MSIEQKAMFVIRHHAVIHAPIARCFALSTSIEIVQRELKMSPVEGRTTGLVTEGDTVLWRGKQLGFQNDHRSLICKWNPPHRFQDRMLEGRFKMFEHDHSLRETNEGTVLEDEVRFTLPFGPAGWLVGLFILKPHIVKLMKRRFALIKCLAESDGWRRYLPEDA